jgi:hypothetical protein
VQIVHADGTNASYCHFKKGSILVSKGQWVAQGQAIGIAGNTGTSSGIHVHFDVHTGPCHPGQTHPLILTHFEDKAHTSWRPFNGTTLDTNNTVTRQDEWRRCAKCQLVFFSRNPGSNCPEGGPHAHLRYGGSIALIHNRPDLGEPGWHHCHKCQTLFKGTNGGQCAEGGTHDGSVSGNYSLTTGSFPSGVDGWKWCWKCHGLFSVNFMSSSTCTGGGTHQPAFDSNAPNYTLHYTAADIERNWAYCGKCGGMHYNPNVAQSTCPAGGTHHRPNTGDYFLTMNSPDAPGQPSWRWCGKCQGLFFGGNPGSVCPEGGAHDGAQSADYVLVNNLDEDAPGEQGWRWCAKCQGLWYSKNNASICPAGGNHKSGTGQYRLIVDYVSTTASASISTSSPAGRPT